MSSLLAVVVFWMLVKSFVEESFLHADPQYCLHDASPHALDPFVI